MKGLQLFGEYLFEFIVVTLLLALSAVTVVLFIPALVGVEGYFGRDINGRRFKDIFVTIGANWKILIPYTLFQLAIVVFPVLNIYFFTAHPENLNFLGGFVLAVSCVALVAGLIYLVTAPAIIVNMRVGVRELIYNGVMLPFGGLWRSLLSLACVGGIVALVLLYPYAVPFTLYPAPYIISVLMTENLYRLKAKAEGVSVYELKRRLKEDGYLDENGKISRSENDNPEENNEET